MTILQCCDSFIFVRQLGNYWLTIDHPCCIGHMAVIFLLVDPQDLCSMNMYDAGVSLSGFACFVTADLARDLANDVMSLVSFTHAIKHEQY